MSEENPSIGPFGIEPPPQDAAEVRARHESNRAAWNEGAQYYRSHLEESIAKLRAGISNLHPIERRNLGDLHRFQHAIHLQCASGYDTLSLWLEGVQRVTGVDISDVHIENARRMSAAVSAPATWYRSDVLDTPRELDGSADLVYTGRGAINWIQDLGGYAKTIARLLKPGGIYHILDDHPAAWLFDMDAETYVYSGVSYFSYFESGMGWPSTYIGDSIGIPVEQQSRKYESLWNISSVFSALTAAGLVVEHIGEHPEGYWEVFPNLKEELVGKVPLTYSMKARKP